MADVRALLAAERQSRRISHPQLTYTKNGTLMCNVCNLNIKSEQLWPGHLKSLNHRQNIQKVSEPVKRPAKRKIDSVENGSEEARDYEVDSRKKPKPLQKADDTVPAAYEVSALGKTDTLTKPAAETNDTAEPTNSTADEVTLPSQPPPTSQVATVDEEEWAAFERDVAPLTQPVYASATIEAAPVSAAELAEQQKTNTVQQREDEADAEKEEESRRMEEEFEVMEEMEDRVKRLRARREALRVKDSTDETNSKLTDQVGDLEDNKDAQETVSDNSSDDDDTDDWYR